MEFYNILFLILIIGVLISKSKSIINSIPLRSELRSGIEHRAPGPPKNPLLPLKTFDIEETPDIIRLQSTRKIFNADAELHREHKESCRQSAKQKCAGKQLITRNDCYIKQVLDLPSPLVRNNQLLGTETSFEQRTNNIPATLTCDCATRDSELCNEPTDESCFQDQYAMCLKSFNI